MSTIKQQEQASTNCATSSMAHIEQQHEQQLKSKRASIQSNVSNNSCDSSRHTNKSSNQRHTRSQEESNNDNEESMQHQQAQLTSAEYERIRNTTLLFFLDRLYLASTEGKEAKTLHELSCLFGTKDFTKEMRQIVSASRNGLKKFLQSYPSLFQIEGDKVYLTQLKQDSRATQRDYNQEAVEYFKQKLQLFGTSLVPIKNLFGYRSQATQEVRHVSGKNSRDFKRFLAQNQHVFEILADEHVVLKSTLAELESSGQTSLVLLQHNQANNQTMNDNHDDHQQNDKQQTNNNNKLSSSSSSNNNNNNATVMDPYLNKQFAHLIEECVKKMMQSSENQCDQSLFKVSLEHLHVAIKNECQNELFLKMVKTIDDLKVFLRMHPKLFKRFSELNNANERIEYVSLLSDIERREFEAQAYPSLNYTNRKNSTTTQLTGGEQPYSLPTTSFNTNRDTSLSVNNNKPQDEVKQQQKTSQHQKTLPSTCNEKELDGSNGGGSRDSKQQVGNRHKQQLRANAPPFVPQQAHRQNSSLTCPSAQRATTKSTTTNQQSAHSQPIQRSLSNLTQSRTYQKHHHHHQQEVCSTVRRQPSVPIDQRNTIRNYLLKGNQQQLASNSRSIQNHHNLHWAQAREQQPYNGGGEHVTSTNSRQQVTSGVDLRARTVDIVREASNIISRIMTTTDAVAFDCKGYNLGFDGQITLIQFGFLPNKQQTTALNMLPNAELTSSLKTTNDELEQRNSVKNVQTHKPEVCVFDLITNPELAYCLKPLLESDKIVKIVHDVRNKSNALYVQFKIILNNVFDTQVANLVIQQQDTGKPAYKSRYISMGKLCEIYGDDELMKYRNIIKFKTRHSTSSQSSSISSSKSSSKDANYWRYRPLTKPMIFEATMDVYCLIGGIYQNLRSKIKPEYEPLFEQLNLEGVLARIKPDEIRGAKKERKIDLEVIDLKRKLYTNSTGPVVLSNREIRLLRHIDLTEEVRQKIQQCKKVAKKLERLDMKAAQILQQQQQPNSINELQAQSSPISLTSSSTLSSTSSELTADNKQPLSMNSAQGLQQRPSIGSMASLQLDEDKLNELNATGMMTNLIDSSMFDDLKDKMIESSSLLDSLKDDDDDGDAAAADGHLILSTHSHHSNSSTHDCCRCQCHHKQPSISDSGSIQHQHDDKTTSSSLDNNHINSSEPNATQETSSNTNKKECELAQGDKNECKSDEIPLESKQQKDMDNSDNGGNMKEANANDNQQERRESNEDSKEEEEDDANSKSSSVCDMAVQCDLLLSN